MTSQVGRIKCPKPQTTQPVSSMDSGENQDLLKSQRKVNQRRNKLQEMNLAIYNIQYLSTEDRVEELELELTKINWDQYWDDEIRRREKCLTLKIWTPCSL